MRVIKVVFLFLILGAVYSCTQDPIINEVQDEKEDFLKTEDLQNWGYEIELENAENEVLFYNSTDEDPSAAIASRGKDDGPPGPSPCGRPDVSCCSRIVTECDFPVPYWGFQFAACISRPYPITHNDGTTGIYPNMTVKMINQIFVDGNWYNTVFSASCLELDEYCRYINTIEPFCVVITLDECPHVIEIRTWIAAWDEECQEYYGRCGQSSHFFNYDGDPMICDDE